MLVQLLLEVISDLGFNSNSELSYIKSISSDVKLMTIWIISDTHFMHKNIIKYCNRPFKTVEEMDEVMISNWNQSIDKDDVVIHLGDFSLGSKIKRGELRSKLNGTIILILGSHDGSKYRIAKDGFIVVDSPILIDDFVFTHKPIGIVPDDKWNIHGHIHEKETSGRRVNVSVEQMDYKPIKLNNLYKLVDR